MGLVRRVKIWLGFVVGLLLVGCGGETAEILGKKKQAPDEFTVIRGVPLSMPPDFGLRPPRPGDDRAEAIATRNRARDTLYGQRQAIKKRISELNQSEDAGLLLQVEAEQADPDIRKTLTEEARAVILEQESFVDDLLFWREKEVPSVVVDPVEETRRLQENTVLGQDLTEGETPMIQRGKGQGLLPDLKLDWPW